MKQLGLSRREYEVLMWAARGKTYMDIGAILNLGYGSIKTYLDCARYKLQAANIPHAVAIAFSLGIFTPEVFTQRTTLSDVTGSQPPSHSVLGAIKPAADVEEHVVEPDQSKR